MVEGQGGGRDVAFRYWGSPAGRRHRSPVHGALALTVCVLSVRLSLLERKPCSCPGPWQGHPSLSWWILYISSHIKNNCTHKHLSCALSYSLSLRNNWAKKNDFSLLGALKWTTLHCRAKLARKNNRNNRMTEAMLPSHMFELAQRYQ